MKVLISAFSCAPGFGSEPGVAWGLVGQIASRHSVWVLTDEHNRQFVEPALSRVAMSTVKFVFVSPPWRVTPYLAAKWQHGLYYLAWQMWAFRTAGRLHREVGFDLVHHVTYVNSWLPTLMGWLGVPFIWSAGVRDKTRWVFFKHMSWQSRVSEFGRNMAITVLGRFTDVCTGSRARITLSVSSRSLWRRHMDVRCFPLGGLEPEEISRLGQVGQRLRPTFRVASVGRLLGLKGFALGLHAFARLYRECPDAEYWIIGDGPERRTLERLARKLGCSRAVSFLGALRRDDVLARLSDIDVLIHPSLHEQFGCAALEAMAAARPVICLEIAGCKYLVGSRGGIMVPLQGPAEAIEEIYTAAKRLMQTPEERLRLGREAREWASAQWAWTTVGHRLLELYEEVQKSAA